MKKAVVAVLVMMLAATALAGCKSTPTIAKIGLGHITSIAKSADLKVAEDGTKTGPVAQVDTVIAAVGFDKDGKVLKVAIDTSQSKIAYDENLALTTDVSAKGKTKVELGDAYGMGKVSTIKKEWYQQAAELEKWMVGKTVAEIKAMKTKQRDASHTNVPDVPELTSLVTITVQDYIAAVEEASKNAVEVGKGAVTLGLGHVVDLASSRGYSKVDDKETLPQAQVNFTISAAAFDKDGKVVKNIIDTCQTRVAISVEGKITTDKTAEVKSKKELGDAYGMKKSSGIGKEWFEQIAELEKWMVGKTASQISGMKTKTSGTHEGVPDVPELTSLVTVGVADYLAATAEAASKAK
ncbi:MAG: hypothetical protein ACM3WU_05135 [Bacillota bacterium]